MSTMQRTIRLAILSSKDQVRQRKFEAVCLDVKFEMPFHSLIIKQATFEFILSSAYSLAVLMMSTDEKCSTLKYLNYILWPAFALTARTGYLYTSYNFLQKKSAHLRGFLPKRRSCRFDLHLSQSRVWSFNAMALVEVYVKRSVILMDRLSPQILSRTFKLQVSQKVQT